MKHKMKRALLILVLLGTLSVLSKTETASASGTIYIRENGSIDPLTAPIDRVGDIYTFTGDIYEPIVIQRDNIIVDGNGHMLQGSGSGAGFDLTNRNNVTLKNTRIIQFNYGISLYKSNGNTISYNNLTNNVQHGIFISNSSSNMVSENGVVSNTNAGIFLWLTNKTQINGNNVSMNGKDGISIGYRSFNNTIAYNVVRRNSDAGISLGWEFSTGNRIIGNNITHNGWTGIYIVWSTVSNNEFYHNTLDNELQVTSGSADALNVWDNGYLSGGNYWSDYTGSDLNGDGIGDSPYIIDADNQDNYPFMNPWTPQAYDVGIADVEPSKTYVGQGYDVPINVAVTNQGGYTQTFNITAYANQTKLETKTISIASQSTETLTFTWNTVGVTKGFYTLNATADQMPGEIDALDNTGSDGTILVTIAGDANGDRTVNVFDILAVKSRWGRTPGSSDWISEYDVNDDDAINVFDILTIKANWGQYW